MGDYIVILFIICMILIVIFFPYAYARFIMPRVVNKYIKQIDKKIDYTNKCLYALCVKFGCNDNEMKSNSLNDNIVDTSQNTDSMEKLEHFFGYYK